MGEILEVLAVDVRRLADFARRLELAFFQGAPDGSPGIDMQELQKFDALIQHLDDLEAILGSLKEMAGPAQTVQAAELAEAAKMGHYRRIFGLASTEPSPRPCGDVDLF